MKKITRRIFIFGGLAGLAAGGLWSWSLWRRFGTLPDSINSPNWHDGAFHNPPGGIAFAGLEREPLYEGGWLKFVFERGGNRYPPGPVRSVHSSLRDLEDGEFVWLGHSSCIMKLAGKIICVDPVLASRASPVPFTIPAWPGSRPWFLEDFPEIDYLCISHDHWDHLDYEAVTGLRYRHALCGKGVGAHFAAWGLRKPVEMDWGDEWRSGPLNFVFTPSRHFSGRGLTRNRSLWGGFIIDAGSGGKSYFTGDGGYGSHFADIGEKYGPFDIIFPDCGQYNRSWAGMHMFPEQSVLAAKDARARLACPVHHGKFTLAWHPWDEPEKRFSACAREKGLNFILPAIGEKCRFGRA